MAKEIELLDAAVIGASVYSAFQIFTGQLTLSATHQALFVLLVGLYAGKDAIMTAVEML